MQKVSTVFLDLQKKYDKVRQRPLEPITCDQEVWVGKRERRHRKGTALYDTIMVILFIKHKKELYSLNKGHYCNLQTPAETSSQSEYSLL